MTVMSTESGQNHSGMAKGCLLSSLAVVFVLFVIGVLFLVGMTMLVDKANHFSTTDSRIQRTMVEQNTYGNSETIAVIRVDGVITSGKSNSSSTSSHDVSELINGILEDGSIDLKALIVVVDSPGGELTASDVMFHAINKVKMQGIPVIVQMESMAASGGYYISSHADHIVANPTTLTGSIGVIITGINVREGMDKLGIRSQVFTSGEFKDMLSPMRDMRPDEASYVQDMVNESYDRFVTLVSSGRKIGIDKLRESKAIDGRVISGKNALALGLVDSLGYWEDAVAKARQLSGSPDANVVIYQRKTSFSDLFSDLGLEAAAPKTISVEIGNTSFPKLKPGVPYLLPVTHATGSVVAE